MMHSAETPCAQKKPASEPLRRVWDAIRHRWIEAASRVRLENGRFGPKDSGVPPAELSRTLFDLSDN